MQPAHRAARNRLSADIECYGIANTCFDRVCYRLRVSDYSDNCVLDVGFDKFPKNNCAIAGDHRRRDYPNLLREQLAVLLTDS